MKTRMLFHNRLQPVLATFAVSLFVFGLPARLCAQWTPGTGGVIYYNGGNVGIGTTSPQAPLDVNGAAHVGQTANASGFLFNIAGANSNQLNISASDNTSFGLLLGSDAASYAPNVYHGPQNAYIVNVKNAPLVLGANNGAQMTIQPSGNVGIGTASPQHTLHVAGTIGAEQVIVSATGADYVFDPNYHLAPLREVATYLSANHHLPGIPSADDMQKQGVSLGEMQTKLLAKVEELTLHMIAADERNTRLEEQNRELQARIAALERQAHGNTTTEKEK
jgi:hypothetical protein